MPQIRKYEDACDYLRKNGLRFSRQRMVVINEMFFNKEDKTHFKLNEILQLIKDNHKNINISSASLTNILKGLCNSGHIREVHLNKPYYDTNTDHHLHFYDELAGKLMDVKDSGYFQYIRDNVEVPQGYEIKDVNCIIDLDKF
jgi:Fur family transcriptional regulator, iron response regulator